MIKRILFFTAVLLSGVICISAVVIYIKKETPLATIQDARALIAQAENLESHAYAKVPIRQAHIHYDSAMAYWQTENAKWFFQRDFSKSIRAAIQSKKYAEEAIKKAKTSSRDIKKLLAKQLEELSTKVKEYNATYSKIPLSKSLRNDWSRGSILLEEGKMAFKSNNYLKSAEKLDSAAILINRVVSHPKEILSNYLKNVSDWQEWAEEAIRRSKKQKSHCIVVDKYARNCYHYKAGQLIATYEVDLGPNWVGDKHYQGDKATPEGHYKVLKKKMEKETKYYKAFLLDYPNEEDTKRFEEGQKQGRIAAKAKIGGLIELHGNGGKGVDWTDGCVAVSDRNMDKLYAACPVGTEVIIVGSLKTLDKLIAQ